MKIFLTIYLPIRKLNFRHFTSSVIMQKPIVTVKEGKLLGSVKKLKDGTDYFSFKGVPYAQPPIGKLRFKAPLPPKPWNGVLEAIEHGPNCPQMNFFSQENNDGDENCLFLNIYTRSLNAESKIPVMVYVHGGGFSSGSGDSDMLGPEFLLQHNVTLITINYRLEVLGFLCLDIPDVPGNAGLKDQVTAFRWVKSNVSNFGGDPDNITIFGESAGGASITYHMLSPMSKGLYHKAISQSGTCLQSWAIQNNGKERAFRAGKYLGKNTNDPQELLEFLQSVPFNKLLGLTLKTGTLDEKRRDLPIYFAPVVEKIFPNSKAFLTEKPLDVLLSGKVNKVPFITGYNSAEGLMMVQVELKKLELKNKKPSYFVPRELVERLSEDKIEEFGKRIKQFYNAGRDLTPDDIEIISKIQTDINFLHGTHRFVNFYSEFCKSVYMYRFNLSTDLNFFKMSLGFSDQEGTCHADDLFYIFHSGMTSDTYDEQQKLKEYVYIITKLWTDFAKTGNPTPDDRWNIKWTPYTKTNREYLRIDETLSMGSGDEKERIEFWNKLYSDAGLPVLSKSNL